MIKLVKFLGENVSKEDCVRETCAMLNSIFPRTDDGFAELNQNCGYLSAAFDKTVTIIYDSDLDVFGKVDAILEACDEFKEKSGIDINFLMSSMLDRIRVKKGIDLRKINCVNVLCRTMESMGFIVNPTEYNNGVDTFSFSKDCSISNSYILQCSFNRCFENWVEFRKKFKAEFSKYQSELANTPLSLWR